MKSWLLPVVVASFVGAPLTALQDADRPIRVGGNVPEPRRVVYVPPEYPQEARDAGVQGVVIVEVIVGTDGTVENARVLRSIEALDAAALAAVRQWEYEVTSRNGEPVSVIFVVTVAFSLSEDDEAESSEARPSRLSMARTGSRGSCRASIRP